MFISVSLIWIYTIFAVFKRWNHGRWILFTIMTLTFVFVGIKQADRILNKNLESADFLGAIVGVCVVLIPLGLLVYYIGFGGKVREFFVDKS